MRALLEVERLSKRFRGLLAVDSVSFAVEQGSIFAVIGPNGGPFTVTFKSALAYQDVSSITSNSASLATIITQQNGSPTAAALTSTPEALRSCSAMPLR